MKSPYFSNSRNLYMVLALVIGLTSEFTVAKTYRYYDDQGNLVYSQSPPPDNRKFKIIKGPHQPSGSKKAQKELLDHQNRFRERSKVLREKKQQQGEKQQQKAQRKKNCTAAKKNLTAYQNGPNNLFRDKDGNVRRLEYSEWQEAIKQQEKHIETYCE